MSAENPITGKIQFFVDKCLPFGSSISCALFQRFSNALKHITQVKTLSILTNYLDDFLFMALTIMRCNFLLQQFLDICELIGIPIAFEKTEWAAEVITFLGLLLNGRQFIISIPLEKKIKAETLLRAMLVRPKTMIKDLQALCGYLNFIGRAVYPGRVFTRRMYAKYAGLVDIKAIGGIPAKKYVPKPYHHIRIDREFKSDCEIWLRFITEQSLENLVN